MADNTRDVELRLIAKTSGEKEIQALAADIKALAKQGGDAAPEFARLAGEVEKLGAQIGAVDTLGKLRAEVEQLGASQKEAAAAAQTLAGDLDKLKAATKEASAAEDAALNTLKATQRTLAEQRDELARLRATHSEAEKATASYRTEAQKLNLAILDSKAAIRDQKEALEQARASSEAAADAEGKLAKQYKVSQQAADASLAALRERQAALQAADAALKASGVATEDLVQAQASLVDALQRTNQAAIGTQARMKEVADVEALAAQHAKDAAAEQQRLNAAFTAVGDNSRSLKAEIDKINASLDFLARNTRVSGDEFDRAFASGQARIAKLRAELDGVKEPATGGAGGLNLFRGALGQLAAVFGAYEAGSFVVKAVNDLEQMRRVLTLVTGSSETAAKQIEFLKTTANQAGVSFGTIAGEFSRFEASLLSAGISLKTTNDVFASVTKAAGVLGQSSADTEAALRALGQMASKGKVSMEELGQQLGERMPAVLSVTAKSLGLTTSELIKLMESGKLLADEEFFAAFGKAVDKTFVQGAGKISGMRAEFNRFVGTVTEGVQILSDSALGQAAGLVLGGIGKSLQYLVFVSTLVGESFDVMGKQVGTVIAAMVSGDFKNLGAALDEIKNKSDDKLTALVARMQGVAGATSEAGAAATTTGQAMQQAAAGAQTNAAAQQGAASAATANATAQGNAAAATTAAGAAAGKASSSWAVLQRDYTAAQDAADAKVRTSDQLVKAARTEGEAIAQIARLTGDVTMQRLAEQRAAEGIYAAEVALQQAKQAAINVQVAEIEAMREYIRVHGDANGARAKEIADRETKLRQSQAEIERNNVEVSTLKTLLVERQAQTAALADNSKRVDELRTAYERSKVAQDAALQTLTQAQFKYAEGKLSQEGLNAAVLAYEQAARGAAGAATLYRDSLTDAARAAALNAQAVQVAASATQARLQVQQQGLETSARIAQAEGNEAAAADFSTRAKWKQIEAVRAAQQAKISEANATIAALEAQRNELTGTDDISATKRAEIDLRIQNERVKLIEASASDDVVRGLRAEIDALGQKTTATLAAVAATEKLEAASAFSDANRAKRLAGQTAVDNTGLQNLEQKMASGTLSAADLATAKAVLDASKTNSQLVFQNRGAFSLQGQASVETALASAQAIYERVQSIADAEARKSKGNVSLNGATDQQVGQWQRDLSQALSRGDGAAVAELRSLLSADAQGRSNLGRSLAPTTQVTESTKTINVNIGGKITRLKNLSDENADALTALLRQLESAASTSGD